MRPHDGWPEVRRAEVLRRRLAVQSLSVPGPARARDVVESLTCVQSQEWAHGFWSLGLRTGPPPGPGLELTGVQAEFDAGEILRTHILRPTWHYVSPADIGWILAVTSPRVHQRNQGAYRQTGIDQALRERSGAVLLEALAGTALTRVEVRERLAAEGIDATGMRLAHVVMPAELDGLIASGPLRGAQHTYRRLDEVLAGRPVNRPDDPEAELLSRFLVGHGPATLADFSRWCSFTVTAARAALERLRERDGDRLIGARVVDVADAPVVWWYADGPEPVPATGAAYLLPLYDELTLSYPLVNFDTVADHPHEAGTDLFVGSIVVDAPADEGGPLNVGLWQRTVQGRRVSVELSLAPSSTGPVRAAAEVAAEQLAGFLGKERVQGV